MKYLDINLALLRSLKKLIRFINADYRKNTSMAQQQRFSSPYISQIVDRLQRIRPEKIILFGSHAYGMPHADSDIDLIVVLNKRGLNSTYREKSHDRMVVSRELLEIERETPIDALVYTLDEWSAFLMQDSAFAKLIRQKGVVLYEAKHAGMVEPSQR